MWKWNLTAVVLIRVVQAVLHMVTAVAGRDTLTLLTGELVGAAGSLTCVKRVAVSSSRNRRVFPQTCLFCLSFLERRFHVPQALSSSEPSRQSSSPSQTNPKEMHSPLVTHLNSSEEHEEAAATTIKRLFESVYVFMNSNSQTGSLSSEKLVSVLVTVRFICVICAVFGSLTPPFFVQARLLSLFYNCLL